MKYKACCEWRCLLGNCDIRDNGGCKCVCNLKDAISGLESVIEGIELPWGGGYIYYPNPDDRKKFIDNMSDDEKKEWEEYKTVEAPQRLIELRKKFIDCQVKD